MKKFLMAILTTVVLFAAVPSFAVGISVGGTVWYQWWESSYDGLKLDPDWMYGPALSVAFTESIRLNAVFYHGEFDTDLEGLSATTTRNDFDTSVSYRISDYITVLAGFKYLESTIDDIYGKFTHRYYGPAIGFSTAIPLAGSLSLSAGLSGIYMWQELELYTDETGKGNGFCYNATAALNYFIEAASVTLSLGGRYQYYNSTKESDDPAETQTMKFYGITAAAVYSFSL